jgi:hypothetical protein
MIIVREAELRAVQAGLTEIAKLSGNVSPNSRFFAFNPAWLSLRGWYRGAAWVLAEFCGPLPGLGAARWDFAS